MALSGRTYTTVVGALGALVLGPVLVACGGGSSGGSSAAVKPAGSSSDAAAVTVHSGPSGKYLTDAKGRTLYIFSKDTSTTSSCAGACTSEWPAFTTNGTPTAKGGATASMVSTGSGSGGATQVTYSGHPLYYYVGDSSAGDMNGQGLNDFGGLWTAVTPTGTAVKASTSSSGGGGYQSPTGSSNGWG